MNPVIALVGRPNVGKSTLFNRLTRTRDALVADFPGLTRDRKYGKAVFAEQEFILIDTGGIEEEESGIFSHMADQSLLAIDEADIVFFVVDAKHGLLPADFVIASHLRNRQKATYLVVNKIDGQDESNATEFYELALGELHLISASHGRGISSLMHSVIAQLPESEKSANVVEEVFSEEEALSEFDMAAHAAELAARPIKVAIVGRPNVGKSTLTNRILGEERVVVFDMPGTTRDSIYIPLERDNKKYILIDTAGVRRRAKVTDGIEKFSVIKTLQAIEDANVVLLTIDAREGISDQDLSLLSFILNSGRSLVLVVNKWDGLNQQIKDDIKETLDRRLKFIDFARLHFISALHGSGVGLLFKSIQEAYTSATTRVSTPMLTKIMEMAVEEHQPPLVRGRRVKLKYAHAGGYNPPTIIIHGNQVESLPDSYKRYLINYFRRSLKIMGTPIRVQFKGGDNPFAGRRNKLTPNQQRKRDRLIKHIKKGK